jgi:hypothetical protein
MNINSTAVTNEELLKWIMKTTIATIGFTVIVSFVTKSNRSNIDRGRRLNDVGVVFTQ